MLYKLLPDINRQIFLLIIIKLQNNNKLDTFQKNTK